MPILNNNAPNIFFPVDSPLSLSPIHVSEGSLSFLFGTQVTSFFPLIRITVWALILPLFNPGILFGRLAQKECAGFNFGITQRKDTTRIIPMKRRRMCIRPSGHGILPYQISISRNICFHELIPSENKKDIRAEAGGNKRRTFSLLTDGKRAAPRKRRRWICRTTIMNESMNGDWPFLHFFVMVLDCSQLLSPFFSVRLRERWLVAVLHSDQAPLV